MVKPKYRRRYIPKGRVLRRNVPGHYGTLPIVKKAWFNRNYGLGKYRYYKDSKTGKQIRSKHPNRVHPAVMYSSAPPGHFGQPWGGYLYRLNRRLAGVKNVFRWDKLRNHLREKAKIIMLRKRHGLPIDYNKYRF